MSGDAKFLQVGSFKLKLGESAVVNRGEADKNNFYFFVNTTRSDSKIELTTSFCTFSDVQIAYLKDPGHFLFVQSFLKTMYIP
jgi:hypothetical protein